MEEYTPETTYKIETVNQREALLMLNAKRMACALYDLLCWQRRIYNGKNYGEGVVLYRGKLYDKNEWINVKHEESDYDPKTHFLKDKVEYLYTEKEVENILDENLRQIRDFIYDYME